MENNRTNDRIAESGIALVSALLVTAVCMIFIAGIYFLMGSGWKVALINKTFSSVQEATTGAAEHAAEVIRLVTNEASTTMLSDLGIQDLNVAKSVIYDCDEAQTARIEARTADGLYTMRTWIACRGKAVIPGTTSPIMPPPPKLGGLPTHYVLFSVISEAKDVPSGNIARVEAVYRIAR